MWRLIISGIFIHIILFYSIFDIYFTSPVIQNLPAIFPENPPLASRLVLFVADGLRADKLFGWDENFATSTKYLRMLIEKQGAWGVSHTRVPTESRPGHVAIIAGFYEDVSAVTRGWKENPVEFDSVFNESRHTWSWGSPDIVPIFAKGAAKDRVTYYSYSASEEDFAASNPSDLDTWVLNKFRSFLDSAKSNDSVRRTLHQDKIIFFLHLLGLDVTGHSSKPHSHNYQKNLRVVDEIISQTVEVIDSFYHHDGRTAYIMTSDHGMTDWGSHGAGDPQETLTPLVAWGAGIRRSLQNTQSPPKDVYSKEWNLQHIKRSDVRQADIAPLMSAILGVPFPTNNVGTLPLDYLNATEEYKAESIFLNSQQILKQYNAKMQEKKNSTLSYLFSSFKKLSSSKEVDYIRNIRRQITQGRYNEAIANSKSLIELALEGLNYYHKYDRILLGFCVAISYLALIVYILMYVIRNFVPYPMSRSRTSTVVTVKLIFVVLGSLVMLYMVVQRSPWTHILYTLLPVVLWSQVFLEVDTLWYFLIYLIRSQNVLRACFVLVGLIIGLELLVASFFHRKLLSIALICVGVWITACHKKMFSLVWLFLSILVAVFPLLPVIGKESNHYLVLLAGVLVFIIGAVAVKRLSTLRLNTGFLKMQLLLICLSVYIVMSTYWSFQKQQGLLLINQLISWTVLISSPLIPLLSVPNVVVRLMSIHLAFMAPYFLLSMSHEGLFIVVFCCVLFAWLHIEGSSSVKSADIAKLSSTAVDLLCKDKKRYLTIADLRVSFTCILFILTGFFGTGNIASINSFDVRSLNCFVTVFSPFTMSALLLWKNIIPLIMLMCAVCAVLTCTRLPTKALFLLILAMSDFMALNFFFLIREEGSWLDIGTSISHYVIMMSMIIFFMVFHTTSHYLTTTSLALPYIKSHQR